MKNRKINPADLAGSRAILDLVAKEATDALRNLLPGTTDVATALDAHYGQGKWFLFWDEDLGGRPVRGTISLAFGKQTLIVG